METSIWVILLAVGMPASMVAGYLARKFWAVRESSSVEAKSKNLIDQAKAKQKEILIQAKDKAIKVIDEAKKEVDDRRRELRHLQGRLEKREALFDQKILEMEGKQQRAMEAVVWMSSCPKRPSERMSPPRRFTSARAEMSIPPVPTVGS